ncbi:GntR family transcriptional regulator [Arenibaculum pallidiluteum]|uniref:GntR family transcriptional regulator n=1 Tax=Arenibaculum pallidiluteum TaxID=2812559 RepID=UPI001A9762E4|nr:GntR family transcriptional regulator [Arenibaculum pallidiluteum]
MLAKLDTNSDEPIAKRVFRELRNAIVSMRFRPGRALSEQEIARQLGVSRQPVREAFIKLSEAGLVTVRPQRGTFVVKISVKQVFDVRFVREAVELAVVRRACEALSAESLDEIHANMAAQRAAAEARDNERFLELDEAFHRAIALGAGCERAWRVVEEAKAQMDRVRYLSLPNATPIERLIEQHQEVVDGIIAHDAERAESAMRLHLREILSSLPELERRFPDLFEHDGPGTSSAAA